jgi:toxin secretion/phage lysis holin
MVFDYVTGICAAYILGEIKSRKSMVGAIKKTAYMLLVVLGFLLDFVLSSLMERVGLSFTTAGFFGLATTCWLIGTEAISIIENLGVIGVPIPEFLSKGFEKLINASKSLMNEDDKSA